MRRAHFCGHGARSLFLDLVLVATTDHASYWRGGHSVTIETTRRAVEGEALVATAVGLLVAIPAVVLYNLFNRWVRGRLGRTASLSDLVLARLEGEAAHHGS